ncbi:MAG: 4-hydroxybenzoate octaprenyltransferase [Alphaproteobacteria bacterium MarineAlpha3_Bin5]|nr:4-hydroxybenzoate octaprenyltransferase [Magnetovibrio sp.]PPR78932.1 MAG: 4-hydroxybenzoate octaprenyltransferase [Alphaproteobacteria bacterium MarineAlpha3_Bin5]|tara:strand:- start:1553 stop:2461 length:909 start_codon:yes stop_codon:yes gene_type:complete
MKDTSDISPSDIKSNSLIEKFLPNSFLPYSRLGRFDRPIGIWLLLIPCLWSASFASRGFPDGTLLLLFLLGAIVMRGAGCTINDIVDRKFDQMVARTASRPIPSGLVSLRGALAFLSIQLIVGLIVLVQFDRDTILIGLLSIPLIVLYPFSKQFTDWPQLFLGLVFNWGVLLGWSAVRQEISWAAILLYCGAVFWTLGYDTIYGHQDRNDDKLIGLRSLALKFEAKTKPWLCLFFLVATLFFAMAGWLVDCGWPFYASLLVGGAHFFWQVKTLDINDPANCLQRFKSNRDYGVIIFFGINLG